VKAVNSSLNLSQS